MCQKRGLDSAIHLIAAPFLPSISAEWCVDLGQQPRATQNMGKTVRFSLNMTLKWYAEVNYPEIIQGGAECRLY